MSSFFDFEALLNEAIEREISKKDYRMKHVLAVLKKYGIRGTKALNLIAELGAVCEEMQKKGLSE